MFGLRKETLIALVLAATAIFFVQASLAYGLGTTRRLGPGFFPLVAASGLAVVATAIALLSLRGGDVEEAVRWRPALAVGCGILAFSLVAPRFGLIPAVALSSAASALGDHDARPAQTLVLVAGICLGIVVVFHYGLGVPIALFRWS